MGDLPEDSLSASRRDTTPMPPDTGLLAHAAIGFALTTLEGRFVQTNPAYTTLTGYPFPELEGMSLDQLIHPEDRAEYRAQVQNLLSRTHAQVLIQSRVCRKDGSLVWLQTSLSVVPDNGGVAHWLAALVEDITERKRREANQGLLEQLHQAFARLTSAQDIARVASALIASHLALSHCLLVEIDEAAEAATVFHDHTTETVHLEGVYRIADFHTPDECRQLAAGSPIAIADIARSTRDPERIARFAALEIGALLNAAYVSDGRWKFVLSAMNREPHDWHPDDGALLTDLASRIYLRIERARAEEALQVTNDTFRHLVENSPFGIYTVNADFQLVQVSAGAKNVFAHVHPLLGRDFAEVLRIVWTEPFASQAIAHFRHTLATGEPYHAPSTSEQRQDTGTIGAFDWKIERLLLPDGRPGVVCHFYDLSEQRRYEAILRERDQFITEFTALVPGVLYVFDLEQRRTVYVNRKIALTLGYSPEELPALGDAYPYRLLHPVDAQRLNEYSARLTALPEGETGTIEYRMQHRDGTWRWFQSRDAVFRRGTDGAVQQTLGIAMDITELKEAESALQESETRFRATFDQAAVGVAHVGLDGRWLRVNPRLCEIVGYSREELLQSRFQDITHPDDIEGDLYQASRLRAGKISTYTMEKRYLRKDNQVVWIDLTVSLMRSEVGEPLYFISIVEDITQRKVSEARLQKSEERFRIAENASHSFVYDWNLATDTEERSAGFTRLLGYRPEEFPRGGAGWEALMHPEDVDRVRALIEEALRGALPQVSTEYRLRRQDGQWIWVINEFVVIRDEQGVAQNVVGSIVDISVQKQQQREIAELNSRLQRAMRETHHRVKNNLQMISSLVEIQLPDGEERIPAAALQRIGQHIRTLASLHDLLTQDSRVAADQDRVPLRATLEKLIPLLQATAGTRTLRVYADDIYTNLQQSGSFVLLVNELLSNALKHGQGDIAITLRQSSERDEACLEVSDDGPGFPPDFDPRLSANTGLELIESLGHWDLRGQTAYSNREEGGARVTVTFPLLREESPRDGAGAPIAQERGFRLG